LTPNDSCIPPCSAAILAKDHFLIAGAELDGVPPTVACLRGREPTQRGSDGRFGLLIAALAGDEA